MSEEVVPYVGVGIRDFQSIREAKFRFPVGITVIVGPTGSGKTAVFRAIKAAILNPINARTYIHHKAAQAVVALKIPGITPFVWIRKKDTVQYRIEGDDKTKLNRKGVHSLLKDFPFPIEDETGRLMNFHTEWDILFPFRYSPSQLFRLFESVFDIVDSATVLKSIREDEESQKRKAEKHAAEASGLQFRLSVIAEEQTHLDVKKVEKLLQDVRTSNKEVYELEDSLKKALRLEEILSKTEGLKKVRLALAVFGCGGGIARRH